MAESVAQNFQALWAYVQDPGLSDDVSVEMKDMLRKFARDAYSVGGLASASLGVVLNCYQYALSYELL